VPVPGRICIASRLHPRFKLIEDAFGFLDEHGYGVGAGLKVECVATLVARPWRIALMHVIALNDGVTVGREAADGGFQRPKITPRLLNGGPVRVIVRRRPRID